MPRMSVGHNSPHRMPTPTGSTSLRAFQASDLSHLHVRVAELRPVTDGRKGWLYILDVGCAGRAWQVAKRYSEIREFWETLCDLLVENHETCTEKCHFLAGCETYKFPKKRLVHTRGVLEERATELDQFFERVAMRLNLCDARALALCYAGGCSTLGLLSSFLEIPTQFQNPRPYPYNALQQSTSVPLFKDILSKDGRLTLNHGRLSLPSLQEVQYAA